MIILQYYIITLLYYATISQILHDQIIISCHEIIRSQHQMKAQGHQASFQATPWPPQVPLKQTVGSEFEMGT